MLTSKTLSTPTPVSPLLTFLYPSLLPRPLFLHQPQTRLASTGPQYRKQHPNARPTKSQIYQTYKQNPPASRGKPSKPPPSPLYPSVISRPAKLGEVPPLPYHVHRTASQQLPIYKLAKRGGNLHQTRIRKIEGNVDTLRRELVESLGKEEKEVVINRLTGHIIIKVSGSLTVIPDEKLEGVEADPNRVG